MATVSSAHPGVSDGHTNLGLRNPLKRTTLPHLGVTFWHVCLLVTLVMFGVAYHAFELSAELLIYPACLFFVALCAWFFWSWRKQARQWLDPYVLFLVAAILFNGGQAFLQVFGLNEKGFLGNVFSPEALLRALFFTMVGITFLHMGALLSLHFGRNRARADHGKRAGARARRATAAVGVAMIAVSVVPWFMGLRDSLNAVMSYGYFVGLFQGNVVTGFDAAPNLLGMFLIPGALFVLAGSGRQRTGLICATAIVGAYVTVHLFLGSRAPAITALFATLWLWHRSVSPVRRIAILLIGVVVIVLLPLVAAIRDLSMAARTSTMATDSFNGIGNPLARAVGEMGSSMSTVAYTIELVPAVRQFDLGKSYFFASLTALPNLFWGVHPTVAHGLLGTWLIWTVDPGGAAINNGLGFSFLAEAYLNFGWYGAPLALLIVGLLLGSLAKWAKSVQDAGSLAAIASISMFILVYARGESASVVRGVFWYSLLPYLAVRLLASARQR